MMDALFSMTGVSARFGGGAGENPAPVNSCPGVAG